MITKLIRKNSTVLAPMAGVTDTAFRTVAKEYGAEFCYTEMISAKALRFGNKKTLALAEVGEREGVIGLQLFGKDAADFAYAIPLLEDHLQGQLALFDINMGCPAPKIVNNGEGAALMKQVKAAEQIVASAKQAAKVPVTVKIRKGFDAATVNAVSFAKALEAAGADLITVHGRLREEYYHGTADWESIKEVVEALEIPVLANGDVFQPEDREALIKQTGAHGVMVGRGALGNPFLFGQIQQYWEHGKYTMPTWRRKAETMLAHAALSIAYKGEKRAMVEFRKHAAWYLKGMRGAAKLRTEVLKLETLDELRALLEKTEHA